MKLFKLYSQSMRFGNLGADLTTKNKSISFMPIKKIYLDFNLSCLDLNYHLGAAKDLYSLVKDFAPAVNTTFFFKKKKLFETSRYNQFNSTQLKLKKSPGFDSAHLQVSLKKKKSNFFKGNLSLKNNYSKGYRVFLLNKFKLQLQLNNKDLSLNNPSHLTARPCSYETLNPLMTTSYFSLVRSTRFFFKAKSSALTAVKANNFNTFSNKLSYLLLNNLLLMPKSRRIKFYKIFFNLKNLTVRNTNKADNLLSKVYPV